MTQAEAIDELRLLREKCQELTGLHAGCVQDLLTAHQVVKSQARTIIELEKSIEEKVHRIAQLEGEKARFRDWVTG
jgi:hypothetical protein